MVDPNGSQHSESSNLFQWVVTAACIAVYIFYLNNRWVEVVILGASLVFYWYLNQLGRENTSSQDTLVNQLMEAGARREDAVEAAAACSSFEFAICFLNQECNKCQAKKSKEKLLSLLHCTHHICKPCAVEYFTRALDDDNISGCVCPICLYPDSPEDEPEYLSNLGVILNEILDLEHMQKFNTLFNELYENATVVAEETEEPSVENKLWECGLCLNMFGIDEMESLFACSHKCCNTCIKNYFAVVLMEKSIKDCVCPYCDKPSLTRHDEATQQFFTHLGNQLQRILDRPLYEMYSNKLRDWNLSNNSNYKWCSKCPAGFISNPGQQRVECPYCGFVSCFKCNHEWDNKHSRMTCEEFSKWKKETQETRELEEYLKTAEKVTCPHCKFVFLLDRGGCLHFVCSQCKHEFCSGCQEQFFPRNCNKGCSGMGLHAHHPKNCLYFLRDFSPTELQQLLEDNQVHFYTERDGQGETCDIHVRNETPGGLVDDLCGLEAPQGFAGFCTKHYIEYLCKLIWDEKLDVSLLGQVTNAVPPPEGSKSPSGLLDFDSLELV